MVLVEFILRNRTITSYWAMTWIGMQRTFSCYHYVLSYVAALQGSWIFVCKVSVLLLFHLNKVQVQ